MIWFKDRDFPEVKRSVLGEPSEILAHVPDPKQLERIIEVHNDSVAYGMDRLEEANDEIRDLRSEVVRYKAALIVIAKPTYGTELCNSDEENNEILAHHFFIHQYIAKKALGI